MKIIGENQMTNVTVEYDQKKCVGAQKCIEKFPTYFSFDGEKAVLKGATQKNGFSIFHGHCTSQQLNLLIEAGESCPVNAIKIIDDDIQKVLVTTEVQIKDDVEIITATYDDLKEFVMDTRGYFLIRIDTDKKVIEVGLCGELNKVSVRIIGKKPLEIYQTIIKRGLLSRFDHAAYLGRELQKAYIALQKGIPYVQDDELVL